jgi:inorganic pyrophosphatase
MKGLYIVFVFVILFACNNSGSDDNAVINVQNYLHDIAPFTSDSLLNVVIEIPAGSNEKWELSKESGQIEWEQLSPDSFRVIDYLPYPANYGFVPQTLLAKDSGGDGDPVDVFVLGSAIARASIVKVRIVGIIHMLDENESDSKLLAVKADKTGFDLYTYDELNINYPGIIDIIKIWLLNYKGPGKINIISVEDEAAAFQYIKQANNDYIRLLTAK